MSEQTPHPELRQRLADLIVAPGRLFRALRVVDPPWTDVLMLGMAIAALSALFTPGEFFIAQMEDAVTRRGQPVDITSSPDDIVRYGRYIAMISALAWHPFLVLALAAIVAVLFKPFSAVELPFRNYLSASAHVFLIPIVGSLILAALGSMSGVMLEPNLAPLATQQDGFVYALLSSLNLFTIWMLVLLGYAMSIFDPARSRARSTGILLGLYFAVVIVVAVLTS